MSRCRWTICIDSVPDHAAHPGLQFKKLEGEDDIYPVRIGLGYRAPAVMRCLVVKPATGTVEPVCISSIVPKETGRSAGFSMRIIEWGRFRFPPGVARLLRREYPLRRFAQPSFAAGVAERIMGSHHISRSSILKGVQAHWRETTVGEHGELVLEGLPFEPGQPVDVLVVSKTAGSTTGGGRSLRDSVLEFREPLEPVAGEDWDALQ